MRSHIVFSASTRPLSVLFRHALEARCARLTVPAGGGAQVSSAIESDGDPASLCLALITWEDISAKGGDRDALNLLESIRRIGQSSAGAMRTVVVFVPYASFVRGDDWLLTGLESQAPSVDWIAQHESTLIDQPHVDALIVSPMLLAPEWQGGLRSPSALQRVLRVVRVLTDEVRSKVPDYFATYPLKFETVRAAVPNAATVDAVVDGILDWLAENPPSRHTKVLWQQSLIPWSRVSARVGARLDVSFEMGEVTDSTAVDDWFNDVVDLRLGTQTADAGSRRADRDVLRVDARDAVLDDIIDRPPSAGETAYHPLRSPDLAAVRGLTWTSIERGGALFTPSYGRGYHAGGAGPAVLLVSPSTIESGYFAGIADNLMRDHRVLIWQPVEAADPSDPQDDRSIGEFTDGLSQVLTTEAPDGVHLVSWCGGLPVAAAVIAESIWNVRSVTLLAPDFGGSDESETHKVIVRFCQQLVDRPDAAPGLVEQARKAFREASANLEQYGRRDGQKRSPLRFHPAGFWSIVPDSFNDPELSLAWARRTVGMLGALESSTRLVLEGEIPKLVVLGSDDAMILAEVARRRLRAARSCQALALLGGNHSFLLEHAPLVGELLRLFFRDGWVDGGAPGIADRVRVIPQTLP